MQEKEKFSLKDHLFNKKKVEKISGEIHSVYKKFNKKDFEKEVLKQFPKLELKARIDHISEMLHKYLPIKYTEAVKIILSSLPPKLDESKTDDDFGDFIYAPYGDFVRKYGLGKKDLKVSLNALKEITKRFSMEDAIRYFINSHEKETFSEMESWSKDKNYHVRRLSSEGLRPHLPWSAKINIEHKKVLPILKNLHKDKTRYVTRSVANHINDISKFDKKFVFKLLNDFQKEKLQMEDELKFIVSHSLRTLLKSGDKDALKKLKIKHGSEINKVSLEILTKHIRIPGLLIFNLNFVSKTKQTCLINYIIHFQTKSGKMNSKKVFKLKKINLKKNETFKINKIHPIKIMTTKKLYSGEHLLEININGKTEAKHTFELIV